MIRRGAIAMRGLPAIVLLVPALCGAAQTPPAAAPASVAPPPIAESIPATQSMSFDPAHTHLGFKLRTRWGQALEGWFPHYDASVTVLPDGRHQVQLNLYVADVDVNDSPRYSDMARSDSFFNARQFPVVTWTSDPYDASLVDRGGHMPGTLTIRGTSRPKTLELKAPPSGCVRPGYDCDVLASGEVERGDYGMNGWKLAIDNHVEFVLRMRLHPVAVSSVTP